MFYFSLSAIRNHRSILLEELSTIEKIESLLHMQLTVMQSEGVFNPNILKQIDKIEQQRQYVRTRLEFFDKVESTVIELLHYSSNQLEEASDILRKTDQY